MAARKPAAKKAAAKRQLSKKGPARKLAGKKLRSDTDTGVGTFLFCIIHKRRYPRGESCPKCP
ncbi:hypothetical protein P3T25_002977 [Paraburkholderia sp. GAS32]